MQLTCKILESARLMVKECRLSLPLGSPGLHSRDELSFVGSPRLDAVLGFRTGWKLVSKNSFGWFRKAVSERNGFRKVRSWFRNAAKWFRKCPWDGFERRFLKILSWFLKVLFL